MKADTGFTVVVLFQFLLALLFYVVLPIAVLAVAWHFIAKFW